MNPGGPDGIVLIDKPAGWTSHDVVAKLRGAFKTRKVGHSGTLDPMATGLLVIGVGRGTKLMTHLVGLPKVYEAEITFGSTTTTLDAEGDTVDEFDMAGVGPDAVLQAAKLFLGWIDQVPPMVSAIRVDGKRLHQYAREGIEVERKARRVEIQQFDLTPTSDPLIWNATVACSSGTYIRSLAADLGTALGGGAHLSALRRTQVGPYDVAESEELTIESVADPSPQDPHKRPRTRIGAPTLHPMTVGVRHLPNIAVEGELLWRVRNGQVLTIEELGLAPDATGLTAILDTQGDVVAIYEPYQVGRLKPSVVLIPSTGE